MRCQELADELHEQFGENKKLTVYSHVLYEFLGCKEGIPADSRNEIYQKQQALAVCLFLKKHRSQKGRLNMKLKDTFVTQEMDGEQVMVEADGGFAGMVRSNATAAFIIDQLKTETTKEAILDAMEKKYDAPRAVMAEDVDMVLANLKKIGALDA